VFLNTNCLPKSQKPQMSSEKVDEKFCFLKKVENVSLEDKRRSLQNKINTKNSEFRSIVKEKSKTLTDLIMHNFDKFELTDSPISCYTQTKIFWNTRKIKNQIKNVPKLGK
jgi:hypothetical protein